MTEHNSRRVSPFRNPRIKVYLATPRGLSQPVASFVAYQRQGIHLLPLLTCSQKKLTYSTLFNCQITWDYAHSQPKLPTQDNG